MAVPLCPQPEADAAHMSGAIGRQAGGQSSE